MTTRQISEGLAKIESLITKVESLITELTGSSQKPYAMPAAAEYLDLKKSHLYSLTSRGLIGHYKPAGKVYFDRADLDEYWRRNRVRPRREIEEAEAAHKSGNPAEERAAGTSVIQQTEHRESKRERR